MAVLRTAALVGAVLLTGLSAGLFYSYACSVMPGLARVGDRAFVDTMQRINTAILNGWFMLGFLGALVLIAAAGLLQWRGGNRTVLHWIVAAAVLYGLLLGLVAEGLVALRLRLHPSLPRSLPRRWLAVAFGVVILHTAIELWAMADNPQLYAAAWYARGQ
ncbi:MAG: DUF1772 domain-containing protein, partial [Kitasatospora sp.]|nr:DUF1772 domain-containing protein [Kitasatospora sp.]